MSGLRRSIAIVLLLTASVALVGAGVYWSLNGVVDRGRRADANSRLDHADREIAWGNGWTLSQAALYAARSLIPEDDRYDVQVGPEDRFDHPLTYNYVESYVRYWLTPRLPDDGARWVLCYRCDRAEFGNAQLLWEDAVEDVAIFDRTPGAAVQ